MWRVGLVLALALGPWLAAPRQSQAASAAQLDDPLSKAAALLQELSPEQRVGQLFLATFVGAGASAESQIYDLIANYHIGGVVLRRDMDNFSGLPDTLADLDSLTRALQQAAAANAGETRTDVLSGQSYTDQYIPLLVAINQEGNGYPYDQILEGLSPQPSAMALGATWDPELARQAGELLGRELSTLGVNMLLGPSLDVLEDPRPESLGDLGARSFGGDPFWVAQMGQAYIRGVHTGSDGRMAVVAKHLPGNGGTDRPVGEEVPTVRESLEQLTQVELAPFFAVTGEAPDAQTTADAMLMAHIRYQGFQGNIRTTTRPISLDAQAFAQLLGLQPFVDWRATGGLVISDNLGTRAIRRNYDSTEQAFNSPLVARDAFLAGNDLLYLGNFLATGDPDAYTSIRNTVSFFAQKYREDAAFAERVDQSALRVLALKFKLYPEFSLDEVLPEAQSWQALQQNEALIFEVGRRSATLLSPSMDQLGSVLPSSPGRFEQIVFITDSYNVLQCSSCLPENALPAGAMADAVADLYGPRGGNQISTANLSSFSFSQLARTLDGLWPDGQDPVAASLQIAEWVVFLPTRQDNRSESNALRRLLSERPDLLQNKKVVVFAMDAPYYLDATDITRVSAYYGLYAKRTGLAQVAARLLFQELHASGVSPVSVEGIGYSLLSAVAPNPAQTIPLQVQRISPPEPLPSQTAEAEATQSSLTPEPTPPPVFQAGDSLSLQAGPVLDHNGHIVPDGTILTFEISLTNEGPGLSRQLSAPTRQGYAAASYSIEAEGFLQILAASGDPRAVSVAQQFEVLGINPEGLALQATQTAQAQMMATASAIPPAVTDAPSIEVEPPRAGLVEWFLTTLISVLAAVFAYQASLNSQRRRWAVRYGLCTLIGGLLVGSYLAFDLPGSQAILNWSGEWGVVLCALIGAGLGWAVAWLWREVANMPRPMTGSASNRSDKTEQ
ncbi:MAG: hypothetical protein KIS80_01920 [Anaerolineales bacterium]|nr:hypothetical protein [Anaerolineales bacterium]